MHNSGAEGKYQVVLKHVNLDLVSHYDCQDAMRTTRLGRNFVLSDTFLCAGGEEGVDTCEGDGGSPLVCPITVSKQDSYGNYVEEVSHYVQVINVF